jgi:hypothetical protein
MPPKLVQGKGMQSGLSIVLVSMMYEDLATMKILYADMVCKQTNSHWFLCRVHTGSAAVFLALFVCYHIYGLYPLFPIHMPSLPCQVDDPRCKF